MKLGVLVSIKLKRKPYFTTVNQSKLEHESTSTLRRNLTNQAKFRIYVNAMSTYILEVEVTHFYVSIASTKVEFERNMVFKPGFFRLTKNNSILTLFK